MSILKEIKYAINSTVGTNIFKPLDQIIKPKSIKLTASDFDVMTPSYMSSVGKLKAKSYASGRINIHIVGSSGRTARILKNNTVINDIELTSYNPTFGIYYKDTRVSIFEGELIEIDAEECYIEVWAIETGEWESFKKI